MTRSIGSWLNSGPAICHYWFLHLVQSPLIHNPICLNHKESFLFRRYAWGFCTFFSSLLSNHLKSDLIHIYRIVISQFDLAVKFVLLLLSSILFISKDQFKKKSTLKSIVIFSYANCFVDHNTKIVGTCLFSLIKQWWICWLGLGNNSLTLFVRNQWASGWLCLYELIWPRVKGGIISDPLFA